MNHVLVDEWLRASATNFFKEKKNSPSTEKIDRAVSDYIPSSQIGGFTAGVLHAYSFLQHGRQIEGRVDELVVAVIRTEVMSYVCRRWMQIAQNRSIRIDCLPHDLGIH